MSICTAKQAIDGGTAMTKNWLSGYTVTCDIETNYSVRVCIKKASAMSNVTNNTPVSGFINYTFKFT